MGCGATKCEHTTTTNSPPSGPPRLSASPVVAERATEPIDVASTIFSARTVDAAPRRTSVKSMVDTTPETTQDCTERAGNHVPPPAAAVFVRRAGSHMCCKMIMEASHNGRTPSSCAQPKSLSTQETVPMEQLTPMRTDLPSLPKSAVAPSPAATASSPLFRQQSLSSPRCARRCSVSFEVDIVSPDAVSDVTSTALSSSSCHASRDDASGMSTSDPPHKHSQ